MGSSMNNKDTSRTSGIFIALALAVAVLLAASAGSARAADDDPLLKERIEVFEDLVRLGDLFDNAGDAANIAVFRAPDLGSEGKVSARRIATAARQHGLKWANLGGIDRIVVRRPSRHISLDDVRRALAGHVASHLDLAEDATVDVRLEGAAKPIHIDPRVTEPFIVREFEMQPEGGTFRAVMGFENSDFARENMVFHGTAIEAVKLMAPRRDIERGAKIEESDLQLVHQAKVKSTNGMAMIPDHLIGMVAKRRLAAGRPVRRKDVEAPTLIERNALVTIVYKTSGLMLKTKGRAAEDGAHGEIISIVNTQTKRALHARVISPNTAVVVSSSDVAAAESRITTGSIAQRTSAAVGASARK